MFLLTRKNDLIKSNKLTKSQINKLINSPCQCQLNLTKKQSQNGGFLWLLASLEIPIISSLISNLIGKGLQVRTRTSKGPGLQIERSKIWECRKPLYGDGL